MRQVPARPAASAIQPAANDVDNLAPAQRAFERFKAGQTPPPLPCVRRIKLSSTRLDAVSPLEVEKCKHNEHEQ